jgi:hypothetical protein
MKTSKTIKTKNPTSKATASAPTTAALDLPPSKKRTAKVSATVNTAAKSAAPAAPAPVAPRREVTADQIAARAYVLWEQRGRPHGQDLETWLQAERQLKEEIQSFTA